MITAFDSDLWLKDQLAILAIRSHKTPTELATIAGLGRACYYGRLRIPEEFSLKELRRLEKLARRYNMSVTVDPEA